MCAESVLSKLHQNDCIKGFWQASARIPSNTLPNLIFRTRLTQEKPIECAESKQVQNKTVWYLFTTKATRILSNRLAIGRPIYFGHRVSSVTLVDQSKTGFIAIWFIPNSWSWMHRISAHRNMQKEFLHFPRNHFVSRQCSPIASMPDESIYWMVPNGYWRTNPNE